MANTEVKGDKGSARSELELFMDAARSYYSRSMPWEVYKPIKDRYTSFWGRMIRGQLRIGSPHEQPIR